jgi:hypothetical protein
MRKFRFCLQAVPISRAFYGQVSWPVAACGPARSKSKDLSLRMARVMLFHTLWQQAFAAALPAASKDCATTLCFHAGAKAMLAFACSLGCLIRAFHKTENRLGAI